MVVLKGIPRILSPDLLSVLGRMGHGDELVLADANFPTSSVARHGAELVRADGLGCVEILEAILQLLPLDTYAHTPVFLMQRTEADRERDLPTPIWEEFKRVVNASEGHEVDVGLVDRFVFYEQAKKAFAVVATGERALYGNVIIKKGVLQ